MKIVHNIPTNFQPKTIWTGDNLFILRGMNSATVDLIYLDPPFNSKANYAAPIGSKAAGAAFKDTWTLDDLDVEWIDLIESKHPALHRVVMAAMTDSDKSYLVYMATRLLEMKRLLKPTGSIYLHCDPTMSHYLKLLMDAIFGHRNFRNEITWQRHSSLAKGSQHAPRTWGNTTDTLLFYAGAEAKLRPYRPMTESERLKQFPLVDATGQRYYDDSSHIWRTPNMGTRPNLCYEWKGFTNPHPSGWRLSKERLEEEFQKGNFVIKENGRLQRRKYERDYRGKQAGNLWTDISIPSGTERTGYPTQKPLDLLRRIIEASSNEGDVILDPFCGCATTCVAADKLDREWVGIDISEKAYELVNIRLRESQGAKYLKDGVKQTSFLEEVIHRTDIPQRTDLGKLPRYNCKENRVWLYGSQEGNCAHCNTHFEMRHLEVDHIIARSKGGTDHIDNLQMLCASCNRIKGNRGMEYLRQRLRLAA